jgi:hypothetical protein
MGLTMMRSSLRDSPQSHDYAQQGLEDWTTTNEVGGVRKQNSSTHVYVLSMEGGTKVGETLGWF